MTIFMGKNQKIVFLVLVSLIVFCGFLLIKNIQAATGFIDPNGDGSQLGLEMFNCTNFFQCIDDGTRQPTVPNRIDYLRLHQNDYGHVQMSTLASVQQVTQITVWVYHQETNSRTGLGIELWNETETTQYGSTINLTIRTSQRWDSAVFSGLSLTQAQLDGLRVKFIGQIRSSGTAGTASIFSLYAEAVYTLPPQYSLEQVAFRWRNDNGGEAAGSQSVGFVNPDSDFSIAWTTVVPGPQHFEAINEGATPNTTDYIATNNLATDEFNMGTISGSGIYNRVDVKVYGFTNGDDSIGVNLVINGIAQTEQIIALTASYAWYSVSFIGLNMSQANLDGLRVRLRHIKITKKADTITVADLQAEIFQVLPAATFKVNENIIVTGQPKNENVRIRFLIKNNGPDATGAKNFRLQVAGMVDVACGGGDEIFSDVPIQANCVGATACMADSSYFVNQDPTSNISPGITDPAGTFTAGKLVENPSNEASSIALNASVFTEIEYNFQFTGNAVAGATYCFRVTDGVNPFPTYTRIAPITLVAGYFSSGVYISSPFRAGSPAAFNVIEWKWSKSNPACLVCNIKLQIKSAPDNEGVPGAWSTTWCGPDGDDGDETDFYTVSTGQLIHTDHNNDQWIQYRAFLEGDGQDTPILDEVKINYQTH